MFVTNLHEPQECCYSVQWMPDQVYPGIGTAVMSQLSGYLCYLWFEIQEHGCQQQVVYCRLIANWPVEKVQSLHATTTTVTTDFHKILDWFINTYLFDFCNCKRSISKAFFLYKTTSNVTKYIVNNVRLIIWIWREWCWTVSVSRCGA